MKKWLLVASILITVVVLGGLYMYNKGPRKLENEKTELSVTAMELFNAFSEDEKKANELYLDKVIEVSGEIKEIANDGLKTLILDCGDLMSTVICEMEKETSFEELSIGDQVVVKGQCTGYLMDVILVKSIIVKK